MVYTERAETAAVSCGTSHATTIKYTTSMDIQQQKTRYEKQFTPVESLASAVSLLEIGEQRCLLHFTMIISSTTATVVTRLHEVDLNFCSLSSVCCARWRTDCFLTTTTTAMAA